jgi:polar amino acid transport system permease protein
MFEILRDNWLLFVIGQYPHGPVGGLAATFILALLGLILSFPLAIAIALARVSSISKLRKAAAILIAVVRGTPFLMVIFWAYFAVPALIGRPIDGFTTFVVALVFYESTYLAEVIRGGIEALPKGQTEAARSLGIGYFTMMYTVVLPQALYNVLPGMVTQFVSIIKETSLAYIISVPELTFAASQINMALLVRPVEVFSLLAITYFVLCFTLSQLARLLERRIALQRAAPAPA